jgi:hypothetical protein
MNICQQESAELRAQSTFCVLLPARSAQRVGSGAQTPSVLAWHHLRNVLARNTRFAVFAGEPGIPKMMHVKHERPRRGPWLHSRERLRSWKDVNRLKRSDMSEKRREHLDLIHLALLSNMLSGSKRAMYFCPDGNDRILRIIVAAAQELRLMDLLAITGRSMETLEFSLTERGREEAAALCSTAVQDDQVNGQSTDSVRRADEKPEGADDGSADGETIQL